MLNSSLIAVYIVIVLLIGYFSSRKQSGGGFMNVNRELGLFAFVSSVVASMVGGGFLVVYTAYIFEFGWGALFGVLGVSLGFIFFAFVAKDLRKWAHKYEFYTIADFFGFYFGKKMQRMISVVIASILILIILRQFIAGSQIMSVISGYSYETSLFVSVGIVLVYLIMGGFSSVVKTDIFQYFIIVFLVFAVGGTMMSEAEVPLLALTQNEMSVVEMVSFLLYGFLIIWISSDIWQRVYAARDDSVVKRGFAISAVFLFIIGVGMTLIAFSARAQFPDIDPAQAFVYGIVNLLPPEVLGLGVVLIFGAIMSTADTVIFVLATNIAKDFIVPIKKINPSDSVLRKYARVSLIGIVLIGATFAYFFRNIVDTALVTAGIEMSIIPTVIASFRWKIHSKAAFASIVSGLVYVAFVVLIGKIEPTVMFVSAIVATAVLFVFQRLFRLK